MINFCAMDVSECHSFDTQCIVKYASAQLPLRMYW